MDRHHATTEHPVPNYQIDRTPTAITKPQKDSIPPRPYAPSTPAPCQAHFDVTNPFYLLSGFGPRARASTVVKNPRKVTQEGTTTRFQRVGERKSACAREQTAAGDLSPLTSSRRQQWRRPRPCTRLTPLSRAPATKSPLT